jgi:hypothetical protein
MSQKVFRYHKGLHSSYLKKSWWEQEFSLLSKLGLGSTQPPVQWVLGILPRSETAGVWH